MIPRMKRPVLISRRRILGTPLLLLPDCFVGDHALASSTVRELIAKVERDEGLVPPVTLGIARVVLRPGASALAITPGGARMIVVESGVLAVASTSDDARPFTSATLSISAPAPKEDDELFVPAGTTVTFGSLDVSRVRNPGARSVVALDVAVFHEEPRPLSRAFTTDDGVSFQLLASANAMVSPGHRVALILERVQLGAQVKLPEDLSRGLTLVYVEAGVIEIRPATSDVFAARAAAAAPYSVPGSLQPLRVGEPRDITAGGMVFLPVGAKAGITNLSERPANVLALSLHQAS